MEAKMMMPANYCVMSEEEMTYTEGGATAVQAFCAWFVPFYGWYKGITAVRDYRQKNPKTWTKTGMDAFYDIGCSICVVSSCLSGVGLIINALVVYAT